MIVMFTDMLMELWREFVLMFERVMEKVDGAAIKGEKMSVIMAKVDYPIKIPRIAAQLATKLSRNHLFMRGVVDCEVCHA